MTETKQPEKKPAPKPLPDWVEVFENLREEAEREYPDGRVRVFVLGKRRHIEPDDPDGPVGAA